MPKATTNNLLQEGWRESQFGGDFGAGEFEAYLEGLLDDAGRWAEAAVGATLYAATVSGSHAFDLLKRAELHHCACALWQRRSQFMDSAGSTSLGEGAYLERREYQAHARDACGLAQETLARALRALGLPADSLDNVPAIASGYTETGRFPQSSEAPLNV